MAPTYVVAYNPSDSPVVVDTLGRQVAGGEWAPARRGQVLDDAGNRGAVVVLTKVDEGAHADAEKAHRLALEWTAAAETWAEVPLELIRDVAKHQLGITPPGEVAPLVEGVDYSEAEAHDRIELVDLLVRANVDPPPTAAEQPARPAAGAAKRAGRPQEA